jgi:XTP/dITP diphosphohydrolase
VNEIVLATRNKGKLREFKHAFEGTGFEFISLAQIEGAPDVEETGETYRENALIKARAISAYTGKPTVGEDSGIEIDAMPGELGVRSARAWGDKPYSEINEIILKRLEGVIKRGVRYVSAIALVDPVSGEEKVVEGRCEGVIHDKREGDGGFGYDPIFFVPEYDKTMAQLPLDLKNKISHRAKSIELLKKFL